MQRADRGRRQQRPRAPTRALEHVAQNPGHDQEGGFHEVRHTSRLRMCVLCVRDAAVLCVTLARSGPRRAEPADSTAPAGRLEKRALFANALLIPCERAFNLYLGLLKFLPCVERKFLLLLLLFIAPAVYDVHNIRIVVEMITQYFVTFIRNR